MTQNTSHAVMSQRHEAHDSLDDFPTPPWAARALCIHVLRQYDLESRTCWEPACNRSHMTDGLKDYFSTVTESDIHQYGEHVLCDFLLPIPAGVLPRADWIITNPPFRLAEQFAYRALDLAVEGVALLVRTQFLESSGRYENLFTKHPPKLVGQFVERVPMVKGRYDPKASTATSYCWMVWAKDKPAGSTQFVWIPPCRKQLERARDYEPKPRKDP